MRYGLGAAALGAAFGWPLQSIADPAALPAPPAAEQQKVEKQTELRGVEDTLQASESSVARFNWRSKRSAPTGRASPRR